MTNAIIKYNVFELFLRYWFFRLYIKLTGSIHSRVLAKFFFHLKILKNCPWNIRAHIHKFTRNGFNYGFFLEHFCITLRNILQKTSGGMLLAIISVVKFRIDLLFALWLLINDLIFNFS